MPGKILRSSAVKASYALVSARLASSQTLLDERESTFSIPLLAIRCFFRRGMISSTEVAGEAVLVKSGIVGQGWRQQE